MICKFGRTILLLAFVFSLSRPLFAADTQVAGLTKTTAAPTNSAPPPELKPGPDAAKVAFITAYMLEKLEYLQHPFDATISARLFDSYLTSLDPQHLHFLQSDVAEFSAYRTNLNRMTLRRSGLADTRPAYEIFYRYMDRLRQHVAYVDELLKTEKFDFNADDRVTLNRKDAPYPKNLDEAKAIWRDRLRYDFLMEKINLETQKTNAASTAATDKSAPPKSRHDQIVETLGKNYHRMLKVFEDRDSNDVLNDYLESLVRSYDPHSDYFPPLDYEDFAMQMNLAFFGIGAELRSEDGYCKIEVLLNGPAKASKKIKVGDRIMAVAQSNQPPVDIFEMPLTKAVRLIRGPKGTEVKLTIIPAGAPDSARQEVTLVRDEVKMENGEAKGKIFEVPDSHGATTRLGVIDLPSFYATIDDKGNPTPMSTTADVERLLKKFREAKVAGVILDLRHNGGGSLEEAIRLAGLFIKEGPVVQIKRANGEIEVRDDTDPSIAYDGPLILLTSRFSASASEIVAGALQDYGRALIVGDVSTFGKGTAQQLFPLSKITALADLAHDPGTLKLTNSKFYRASGASTELRGVAADIVLPSLWNDSDEVGEKTLENHLPWDTIESSRFEKVNMVQPELAELAKRSSERISTNKEFAYLREDIERVQKQREDKTVSLSEKQQLADRERIISDHKARDEERAKFKKPDPKVYDLTVKLAAQPGLPPLTRYTNGVSTAEGDLDLDFAPVAGPDDMTEAVASENEHAEAARLEEAKNILMDYISLSKGGKQNVPMLAR
ncbi:MAG TPA: carboxy terminal-processing peptidase [Verrucomicrobiae bacterium]|jgi:carboxyl-terminal processing protease|nr:carboxy terminal-processing peptidase [Verrucomicrobiae bacterium]